ncbi:hypothetical protein M2459_003477 [Parabacteroides sp. PF5-5]|uniref:DUF3575 domain-containing protein n=1 Tax=unclassified Parabacteroides TaxID=2649774 RepID=UPI0024744137|nr:MULTISPECIES: DUF3575 domain-containing protein [unclassified Parabacteroides]MDH6306896.1 hypothetical protein [Parabacteroides sp. PH5-39]MDH6317716.1 hypothetical protein [Parabacteroides sp. PF5-13]MDH6321588.1 hypothetical protein [Parabacteroides sp. PH5-13]MDH6325283.1 hypothetical protein [Parabacteroides sp. PH5-8]MDH6328901.1 hypothetical protein [Parabacteroides sp. PH5-41]
MKTRNWITVKWIKRTAIAVLLLMFFSPFIKSQGIALKTNLLYDATSTINLGLEIGLAPQWTLELPVNYNPWDFPKDRKLKHWGGQPEVRYWLCEKFNGHFFGLHAHVAGYNVGGLKIFGLNDHRYEGNLYGGGISYGYQWILSKRWSIEATVGVGYAYLDHAKYPCEKCAEKIDDYTKNYFGPTKAGISIIYIIK